MGINCDAFVGYTLDITNEVQELNNSDEIIYDLKDDNEYGLKSYWGKSGIKPDDIVILHDGLNGEFTKLIYVLNYEHNIGYLESEDIFKTVNGLLLFADVPSNTRIKLLSVFNKLFNRVESKSVKAEFILYYN